MVSVTKNVKKTPNMLVTAKIVIAFLILTRSPSEVKLYTQKAPTIAPVLPAAALKSMTGGPHPGREQLGW